MGETQTWRTWLSRRRNIASLNPYPEERITVFLVRRIYDIQPGKARQAATIIDQIGKALEEGGTRSPSRVYFNSGTTPGDKNTVVMEWTDPALVSAYRPDRVIVDTVDLTARLNELMIGSRIEFWELMTDEKYLE